MLRRLLRLIAIGTCLIHAGTIATQIPTPALPAPSTTTSATPQPPPGPPPDPLGRSNPRSMMRELIRVLDREDYVSAVRYMQLTKEQQRNSTEIARDLRELLNCCFDQPLATMSEDSAGSLDDGLPLDQERVGPLKIGNRRADIILVQVDRPDGKIWLVSSMTLQQVPDLHGLISESRIERVMPQSLQRRSFLGLSVAHWIVWLGSLLIPLFGFGIIASIISFVFGKTIRNPDKRDFVVQFAKRVKWPTVLIATIITHLALLPALGFPLHFRIINMRIGAVVLIVLTTWLLRRSITLICDRARVQLLRVDRRNSASMLLLGERLLKVLLVIAAVFAMLSAVGVNTKTALAGLGIGGIAVAFGAQKTIENLLGGILLVSDEAIAVGDLCSISNRMGFIEDITLRSVRMRTVEQTLLLIPAGMLSQENIENFRTRTKMPMTVTIRLQYTATQDQISAVRDGLRKILLDDARVEGSSMRVNLTDFGQWAIEMQIWAYLLTADVAKFNTIREDLLLRFMQVVENAGCKLALPSQVVYRGTHNQSQSDLLQ